MSDRLSDERLAHKIRAIESDRVIRGPWLTRAETLSLLEEVREAREEKARCLGCQGGSVTHTCSEGRIAELEAQNDASQQIIEHRLQTMIEMREAIDAREAQLAEMRREIATLEIVEVGPSGYPLHVYVDRPALYALLDRHAIPTKQPNEDVDHA